MNVEGYKHLKITLSSQLVVKKQTFLHTIFNTILQLEDDEVFVCPVCGKVTDVSPKHGEPFSCNHCRIRFVCYGNGIFVENNSIKKYILKTVQIVNKYEGE